MGNHSKYHCGSGAVIQYLTKHIQNQGVLVKDDSYDLLVVNGEGSMHHDSKAHIKKNKKVPYSVGGGDFAQAQTADFGFDMKVTPEIADKEIIKLKDLNIITL